MAATPSDVVAIDAWFAPTASADGTRIIHLRGSSLAQLWVMAADGSDARALTDHNEKVAFFRRAPGDDRIVYGIDAGGDESQQLWLLDGSAARPLTARPDAAHDFGGWSPDGTRIAYAANDRDPAHFDVLVLTIATGETRRVWHGTHITVVCGFSPDGGRLAVLSERSFHDMELRIVDLASGAVTDVPLAAPCRMTSLRWRADGLAIRALTDLVGGEFQALCEIDLSDGAAKVLAEAPGMDIEAWALSPDRQWLATVENDRGVSLLRVARAEAEMRPTVEGLPRGVVADLSFTPDSAALLFSVTAPTLPQSLWRWEAASHLARPIMAADRGTRFVDWTLVEWTSADGRAVPGWFVTPSTPPPAGGTYPAIIWVHGGPAAQTRPNFRADMQLLLAHGFAVLLPNVRGSTGYGRASTRSDERDKRLDAVADLAAGRAWLAARPEIDGDRIGLMGQSYGGYMVLAGITEYPDLFRAAVDYYGIGDFSTLLATTGVWRRAHRADEYGDPATDQALFERISPIRHVARITAPLLVLHGTRDPRVPFSESVAVVAALRDLGKPVELLTFDYAGHGFIRPGDRARALTAVVAFFKEHLA